MKIISLESVGRHTIYVRQDWLELISRLFRSCPAVVWFMGELTTTSSGRELEMSLAHFRPRERLHRHKRLMSTQAELLFCHHHPSVVVFSHFFPEWMRSIARWSRLDEVCMHLQSFTVFRCLQRRALLLAEVVKEKKAFSVSLSICSWPGFH